MKRLFVLLFFVCHFAFNLSSSQARVNSPLRLHEQPSRVFLEPVLVHVLPDNRGRLCVYETVKNTVVPETSTRLVLQVKDEIIWTKSMADWTLEEIRSEDFDQDGVFETVLSWRAAGTGEVFVVEVWRFNGKPIAPKSAISLFRLEKPVTEGEVDYCGHPGTGHLLLKLSDSLVGPSFSKPYLRRHRSWYLLDDKFNLFEDSYDKAKTWRQLYALSLYLVANKQWRKALPHVIRLHRCSSKGSRRKKRAALLLSKVCKKVGRLNKANRSRKKVAN